LPASRGLPWPKDFKAIDTTKARVRLFEGAARILKTFSEESSRRAEYQLKDLGVEVSTDSLVTAVEPGRIKVQDEWIKTDVTLWASGVAASPLGRELGAETDREGRVWIEQDLSIPRHQEVFVIGDMSVLTS
jgi:NADH dehydrogenase